jgi:hypothetical protein
VNYPGPELDDEPEWSLSGLSPFRSLYAFVVKHRRACPGLQCSRRLASSHLGHPSVPAGVVSTVLMLQALEGRSHREAVAALILDSRWRAGPRAAVRSGEVPSDGVDDVLTAPARCLGAIELEVDAVCEVVSVTGALTGKIRRALDSNGARKRDGQAGHRP